jgi:uncharacterized protein YjbJ (UPF0337 family)
VVTWSAVDNPIVLEKKCVGHFALALRHSTEHDRIFHHALLGVRRERLNEAGNQRKREAKMNWDQVSGQWKQLKGQFKEKWGDLTDDDFEKIAGKRDQLIGKIQQRYGIAKEEAEQRVDKWADNLKQR